MIRHCGAFVLWALCLDDVAFEALERLNLSRLRPLRLAQLEAANPELLQAKANRSLVEYYFTCTPALPLHVFSQEPSASLVTYLDSDLCFFSSPKPFFDELADHSIAIVEHRFPPKLEHLTEFGRFNVGILAFKGDAQGLACLRHWRDQCLEWCYDRSDNGRYADQKYLDAWPARFAALRILGHKGVNLAPWNLENYGIRDENGQVTVDGQPLLVYHFHGLRRLRGGIYDIGFDQYAVRATPCIRESIYRPYLKSLNEEVRRVARLIDPRRRPAAARLSRRRVAPLTLTWQGIRAQLHYLVATTKRLSDGCIMFEPRSS